MRHGETVWSLSGQHTGRTDLPLTAAGEAHAVDMGRCLAGRPFALVLTSPLQRARETCRLAGYGDAAQTEPNLSEWDYGLYEGHTSAEIQKDVPGWTIWTSPVPQGETIGASGRAGKPGDRARPGRPRRCRFVCARPHPAGTGGLLAGSASYGRQAFRVGNRFGERAGL
jgi:broad specificity phosphatase PhoE